LIIGLIAHRLISSGTTIAYGDATEADSTADGHKIATSQIAREIVSAEESIPIENATGSKYHTVYTALIQTHLPELDSLGVITYDGGRKSIRPDRNLAVMSTVAATTSPTVQLLFHDEISEHNLGGPRSIQNSTGD
jgi:hypothetical protein